MNLSCSYCRYDLLSRPVNLFPLEREVINTEFLLVTRDDRRHRKLNLNSWKQIKGSGFVPKRQTKIIIHGFLDYGDVDWIKVTSGSDYNIICIQAFRRW